MNGYLLDTDICVFFLRGKYNLANKIEAVGIENCFVSEITIAELLFGAENSTDYEKHIKEVEFFEKNFKVITINSCLRLYAKEKAKLRRKGTPVAEFDLLIGATAVANNFTMVTRNRKHFEKISDIKIENWAN